MKNGNPLWVKLILELQILSPHLLVINWQNLITQKMLGTTWLDCTLSPTLPVDNSWNGKSRMINKGVPPFMTFMKK